jgi:hypothetical protein
VYRDPSTRGRHFPRQAVAVPPQPDQFAVIGHVIKHIFQFPFDMATTQLTQKEFKMDGFPLLSEKLQYMFFTEIH